MGSEELPGGGDSVCKGGDYIRNERNNREDISKYARYARARSFVWKAGPIKGDRGKIVIPLHTASDEIQSATTKDKVSKTIVVSFICTHQKKNSKR